MVIVLIAAVVVILALGGVNAAYQDPNPEDSTVTGFDDGSPDRADRLIGTIGPIVIDKKALSKLDGFFPWKDKFDPLIYYLVDNRYRLLDPVMVKSIMFTESGFNPNAERLEPQINDKSIGLMQILTETARWVAPFRDLNSQQIAERLYDPITNTDVGCKYLFWQIGRYGRDSEENLNKAIAAYNAGSAKYAEDGQFVNHKYVAKIRGGMVTFKNDFPPLGRA